MVEEYPGNSRTNRPEEPKPATPEKKVERLVSGETIRRKKPLGRRLLDTFFGGDEASSVWRYLRDDVLVPAAKDTITAAVTQGVERVVFGDVRSRMGGRMTVSPMGGGAPYVSYNRASARPPMGPVYEPRREMSRRGRVMHNFDEIIIPNRHEAEDVLAQLHTIVSQYGSVSVSDLYSMVGITPSWTDPKYGWTNLAGSQIIHINNGYLLDVPPPEPLD